MRTVLRRSRVTARKAAHAGRTGRTPLGGTSGAGSVREKGHVTEVSAVDRERAGTRPGIATVVVA
jgi:hypothetical protein